MRPERIVRFYEGSAPDDRGRTLNDVLAFDDDALESTHDYIQWLFPLRERSGANPGAPTLNGPAIRAFHRRPELRSSLRRALDRMMKFFDRTRTQWLVPHNHNHLRLTRILVSLRTLGMEAEAQALFAWLTAIEKEERRMGRRSISETTLGYWENAMR